MVIIGGGVAEGETVELSLLCRAKSDCGGNAGHPGRWSLLPARPYGARRDSFWPEVEGNEGNHDLSHRGQEAGKNGNCL